MEDTDTALDTAVATPPLDTPDLDTAVDTTEDSAMAVATTASVRLRLIPTTDTVTLDSAVDTPLLDTLVLATAVATTDTAVDTDTMVKPNVCLDEIFFNF